MLSSSLTKWSIPLRGLHWLMAALLIVQWASGNWDDWLGVKNHIALGLLVLPLAVLRLFLRFVSPNPHAGETKQLPDRLAELVHWLFYAVMLVLPISGVLWRQARDRAVSFFGWFDLPRVLPPDPAMASFLHELHEVLGTFFLVLLFVHVLGALKRQFLDRQPCLQRML